MRRSLTVAASCVGFAALLVAAVLPRRALDVPASSLADDAVPGVIHVHTTRSDGTGTPDEVAAAAARAGLRFVVFTDHGDATRPPEPPRYLHGVLCVDGVEISTTGGHYIALGLGTAPYPLAGDPRDVVEDVARLGGFGIVAHPASPKPELRWREWTSNFDSIEWLNADSEWRDERLLEFGRLLIQYPFRPAETLATLLDRPDALLARWDALTADRRIVGLAGTDAHARIGGRGAHDPYESADAFLRLPSYQSLFETFSVRLRLDGAFTGAAASDAALVLDAIRKGHLHSTIDAIAHARSFEFTATSGEAIAHEGDSLTPSSRVRFRIVADVPRGAHAVLIRNGDPVATAAGGVLEFTDSRSRGTFRAEVRVDGAPGHPPIPWIVSNPIYVGLSRAEPVAPVTPHSVASELVDVSAFQLEQDGRSNATLETHQDDSSRRATLSYRLESGPRAGQFAALVVSVNSRIAQFERVAFTGRSDRPARVSIQARADGVGERWLRSVYLDREKRPVVVPFAGMTRAEPAAGTSVLDRTRVRSVLIVVDTVNSSPGSGGTIEIENLRWER